MYIASTQIADLLQRIPVGVHLVVIVSLLVGIIIWAFGYRLLRPTLVMTGMVFGAMIGFLSLGFLSQSVPSWVPIAIGAGVAGGVAILGYRFVLSFMLAVCLGFACPLGYYTYTEITGQYAGQAGEPITADDLILPLSDEAAETYENVRDQVRDLEKTARDVIGANSDTTDSKPESDASEIEDESSFPWRTKLRESLEMLASSSKDHWLDAPASQKWGIIGSTAIGIAAGFLVAVFMPSTSAAIVTSLTGGLIIFVSGIWLGTRLSLPIGWIKPESATGTLAMWFIIAFIGLIVQLSFRRKKTDKE